MTPGDGVLACTAAGGLTACVGAETYRITPGDVASAPLFVEVGV